MSSDIAFTTDTARDAAARDALGDWVAQFLSSPGSDNPVLAAMLSDPPRAWIGPVLLPLDQLNRLAGPPGAPVVREVEEHEWRDDVGELADQIGDGHEPAPVIVTYQDDELVVEDGNHRIEAIRRAGVDEAWAVVGFDDPAERDRFVARSGRGSTAAPHQTRVSREVLLPIGEVYDALADPNTLPHWLVGCREIRAVDDGWPEPGTKFHHRVGLVGPISLADSTKSIEHDRPHHLALEVRFRPFGRGRVDFWLSETADGRTRVDMDEAPIGLLTPTAPAAAPLIASRNAASLNAFVAFVNAGPAMREDF